jgi:hypothetical protein
MKSILLFSFQLFGSTIFAQNLASLQKQFDIELKKWTHSFNDFNLSDFKKIQTVSFDNNSKQDFKTLNSFYAIYKPILTFSKDSSKFIDIYSYQLNLEKRGNLYQANPDIDQVIYLFDKKAKYWDRIFFGSIGGWIDDATWITNSKFILVGISKNETDKNAPIILLGDTAKQSLDIYSSKKKSCIQKVNGYQSPKLKALNIKGL